MTDPAPKSTGRKRLPPDQKRGALVQLRLTDAEREALLQRATAQGLPLSDFLRRVLTGEALKGVALRDKPAKGNPANHALVVQLIRLGNNLNQIARAINQGSETPLDWQELETLIERIDALLKEHGA